MKKELHGAAKMRANFIVNQLSIGSAEYYHRDFNIRIDWDGKFDFTFVVKRVIDGVILETSLVTHTLSDYNQSDPPLLVVWDKALDELDRLKTKYILDYDGDLNRYKRTVASMER